MSGCHLTLTTRSFRSSPGTAVLFCFFKANANLLVVVAVINPLGLVNDRPTIRKIRMTHKPSSQKGFTLIASAACAMMVFGMAGLAIDVGRMYITKNEAQ